MIDKKLVTFVLLFGIVLTQTVNQDQSQCQKFIQKFLKDISDLKPTSLPTIIYSGLTTNNPGQYKQCLDSNYSYFLIYFNNQTEPLRTFTSACLPSICNVKDLQKAIAYLNVTVYDYPKNQSYDGLTIAGLVIVSLWAAGVFVWSCIVSFKEEGAKQITKKDQRQRNSINAQSVQPFLEDVDEVVPEFKLFVFYQGYKQLFKIPNKISIFSPIIFLAVVSYLVSIQFSYRLSIAQNQVSTAQKLLNSFWTVFACNTEIALHTIMFILGLRLAYSTYKIQSFRGFLRYFFDNLLKKWLLLFLMTFLVYAFIKVFTGQPLNKVWDLNNGQDCPSYMWQIWFLFRNMQTDCKACLPWMSIISSQIFFIILSAPLLLVFKTSKRLGYGLYFLIILNSMFVSEAILDSKNVTFQPSKLMNGQRQYALGYQPNTFVRMGAFYFGLVFGLFIIEGLQKSQNSNSIESKAAKNVRRNSTIQIILQVLGLAIMLTMYLLIIPYLGFDSSNKQPYAYLIIVPFLFIVGLALFVLPSFWQGQSILTRLTNTVLGWKKWVHLDNISLIYFMIGPMIIAFSNYNNQSNIYYDFTTVFTYAIGDLVIGYISTLIIASAFQSQLKILSSWLQYKVYGDQNKYSVLLIEQQQKQ